MKFRFKFVAAACMSMIFATGIANAQETVVVEDVTGQAVECKTHSTSSWRDNWFIQIGAGIQTPAVEKYLPSGKEKQHLSPIYNIGFGRWFSPYLGFRVSGMYGNKMRWDFIQKNKAQMATVNADLMWDVTSSICGPNTNRVFSFIPFVGIGGTYVWDFEGVQGNDLNEDLTAPRKNQWMIPVSAGLQLRFRLCKHVDFFAEARAQFMGDNFNNYAQGSPLDIDVTAIGGLSFNIGERKFNSYNPCEYLGKINQLNADVNNLRSQLADANAALAAANAQLPCPEVTNEPAQTIVVAPMLSAVRFKINSFVVSKEEKVNVYNVAEYLKANPNVNIVICGYADKNTGSAAYNQALSDRRAEAVKNILTNEYGINADRLSIKAYGSETQPYNENNWNRIVIFTQD